MSVSDGYGVYVMPDIAMDGVHRDWSYIVKNLHNTIMFIDEECDCLSGEPFNFSTGIKDTDNCYVIMSRAVLPELIYSANVVYELVKDEQLSLEKTVIVNKHLYT